MASLPVEVEKRVMDPDIKTRWVTALRSGKYTQGQGLLCAESSSDNTKEFCCLGVLCDLAVAAGVIEPPIRQIVSPEIWSWDYAGEREVLPSPVVEWAGLSAANPDVKVRYGREALAAFNDIGGQFSEIADLIESQL